MPRANEQRLGHGSVGFLHISLLILLVLALLLDGLDVKLLSYAAPLILKSWNITESAFGPAMAAALVGMAAGAWLGGWLGDRVGRRPTLLLSVLLFGSTTFACGYATELHHLSALRFIGGLGFGAVTPNAFALITEWIPKRTRGLAVGFVSVASPLGGMVGATVALLLLPRYGWEGCFKIVGAATLAVALLMIAGVPESPAYLRVRNRLARLPNRWRALMEAAEPADPAKPAATPIAAGKLFQRPLMRLNIGSFLCFFTCQFINYGVAGWLPVILTKVGLPLSDAIMASFTYNAMAIAVGLALGMLVARLGSKIILLGISALMVTVLICLAVLLSSGGGQVGITHLLLFVLVGLIGGCSGGFMTAIYAVVSASYPPENRSTGVGFGVMAGRLGGITTTIVSGVVLTASAGKPAPLFMGMAVVAVIMILAIFVIDRHVEADRRVVQA